jgi:outer membrane protein, multidrug efflux system
MKHLVTCLLAATLVACVGQRPNAPTAAAVIPPASWRGQGASGAEELTTAWWQSFGDSTLSAIVERALANNVDIAIATTRVEAARAQFRLARGQLLPSIALGAGAKRDRSLDPFGYPQLETAEEGEVGISYDLDLFGRLRNASESARASLLATQAARDNVMLAVASSAATGYIGLRALDARLAVVRDTVAARADSLKIVQRRAQTGYATRLELDQAEAELKGTEALVPAVELAIARQENGLSILLGNNPYAIERGVALAAFKRPPVPKLLPAEILRRRPDITEAEQRIVASDRSLDAARAAFMPDIRLGVSGGFVNSTLIPDPAGVFSLGGSILAPIYEGGRLRAGADAAAARRDEAAYQYRKIALNAFREVEDALAAVQRTRDQEQVLQEQRIALARTLVQASKRYSAGYSSYLEQLDAERGLLSADLSLVQAGSDSLAATISLYQALGGGWSQDRMSDAAAKLMPNQVSIAQIRSSGNHPAKSSCRSVHRCVLGTPYTFVYGGGETSGAS